MIKCKRVGYSGAKTYFPWSICFKSVTVM